MTYNVFGGTLNLTRLQLLCIISAMSCVCAAGDMGEDDSCRMWIREVRISAERRLHRWHLHRLQLWTLVSAD